MALLATAPSIGPITASAVVATADDITRFKTAHQFEAFLGLVPGERSSGEKRRIGRITTAVMRACATCLLRQPGGSCGPKGRTPPRCVPGRWPLLSGVANGSLSSRLRGGWPVFSTRCGEMARPIRQVDSAHRERDGSRRAESRGGPRGIEMTESGAASALQLMAAVESRELVSAVRSFRRPKCAEATGLTGEREQKAEQQLEKRGQSAKRQRQVHTTLDAGRRFTESCKGSIRAPGVARRNASFLVSFSGR